MTQNDSRRTSFDLDDLERQLAQTPGTEKVSGSVAKAASSDPLAELARLVADGESGSRSGATDANLDDLFEDFLRGAAPQPHSSHPVNDMVLSNSVEPMQNKQVFLETPEPVSSQSSFNDDDFNDTSGVAVEPADASSAQAPTSSAQFNDMLAEFDAAMRDAGAAPQPVAQNFEAYAPIVSATAPDPSYSAGMVSAGLGAAVAAGAAVAYKRPARRGLVLAGGVVGVALIGVVSLFAFTNGNRAAGNKTIPTIAAVPGASKERPANPGGTEMPNQDREVLQARQQTTNLPQRVAPREEQPLDLTTAQRQAETAPPVRQIPGVAIVAPVSTTPPAGSSAAAPTGARPVASVPITIVGEPPVRAVPPVAAGSSAAPAATMPTMTMPALAAPAAPAAPTAPVAPSAAAPQVAAAPNPATAEPRRVRAVPIRPENGDAPSRAQAQPRVVTARGVAPAAEPDEANAPLQLTPQRGAAIRTPAASRNQDAAQRTPVATQSAASNGSFSVQVAAEGSEDSARSKFGQLRNRYSGVLSGMNPNIQSAEVNGRSVYRVRVGSLSRDEAVSLCERLKSSGGSCFVARN